ncbi:MAG: LysE family transporter [Cohaesibacter sp.]|nr:LysE family transporter [Cohaesibacter sp.]
MISYNLLIAYCFSVLALACIPGLAVSALTLKSLQKGPMAGFEMAMGIGFARLSKLLLVLVLLPMLHMLDASIINGLCYMGAIYLTWNAIAVLKAPSPFQQLPQIKEQSETKKARINGFMAGFFISWANPKTVIFIAAILPRFVDQGEYMELQMILLGLVWLTIAALVECLYILGAHKLQRKMQKFDHLVGPLIASIMLVVAFLLITSPTPAFGNR